MRDEGDEGYWAEDFEGEGPPEEYWRGRRYESRERGGDVEPPWDDFVHTGRGYAADDEQERAYRGGRPMPRGRGGRGGRGHGPPYGAGGRHGTWQRPPLERGVYMGPAHSFGTPSFGRGYEQMRHWRGPYWEDRERPQQRPPDYRGRGPKNWRMSDERIREEVCEWLTDHPLIDASEVDVHVEDGVVTLTGTVESRREKRFASDVCEELPFVRDVMNQLRLHRKEIVGDREGTGRSNGEGRQASSGSRGAS